MLGKVDKQITFSDYWLEGKIPEDSYWSKIRKWANENLTDEMFQPLFSYYGRPSVSPIYTFTAMLIQLEKGYSDREMEEETREYQKTEAFKSDYNKRPNGERTIAQLTRGGGRESRYIGKRKTKWQLIMASFAVY